VRACCQVLLGLAPAPVCWRIERERGKRQPGRPPQPSHSRGSHPHTAQDGEARRRNFPRPPGSAGTSRRLRRHRSTPEPDTGTTAAMAVRGYGGQHTATAPAPPHRHRTGGGASHRAAPATAPTPAHERRPSPGPATAAAAACTGARRAGRPGFTATKATVLRRLSRVSFFWERFAESCCFRCRGRCSSCVLANLLWAGGSEGNPPAHRNTGAQTAATPPRRACRRARRPAAPAEKCRGPRQARGS
jgi:hypothetical protein